MSYDAEIAIKPSACHALAVRADLLVVPSRVLRQPVPAWSRYVTIRVRTALLKRRPVRGLMTRRRRMLIGIVVGAFIAIGAWYVVFHPPLWYQGAPFLKPGVIPHPRFVAHFPPIEFSRPAVYSFDFGRFPATTATVSLRTPSAPRVELIEPLTTEIALKVVDQNGEVRCAASGSPAAQDTEGRAFVESTPEFAESIWLVGCNGFDLPVCDPCQLTVSISNVDPATPAISLVPVVEGGGNELP